MWLVLASIATGVLVGILSGLVGVGGGILAIPIFVYLFKFNQKMA